MPLQNRVDPLGELFADPARGLFMGNRGGRFHRGDRSLGTRRFASRQWICCRLAFNNRQREVWGASYTELFFLDEPTALSAGHRPCFECRRQDAEAFANCWRQAFGLDARPRAAAMDRVLHDERLRVGVKRMHQRPLDELPDGAFIERDGAAHAVRGRSLLRWTPSGYDAPVERPRAVDADILTPPAILAVMAAGYRPRWHESE